MGRSRFPRCKISPNFGLQMLSEVKTIFSFSRTFHRSSEPVRGPEARWRLRKPRQVLGPGRVCLGENTEERARTGAPDPEDRRITPDSASVLSVPKEG